MNPYEIESMLIAKEQQKLDMVRAGTFSQVSNLYVDGFINISTSPVGTFRQNKQEADAALVSLPPLDGEITLSDFVVIHPTGNTAVVSDKVTAFFGSEYATTVWSQRDDEWVTVFYQASPILDPAPSAGMTGLIPFSGSFKSGTDTVLINPDGTYTLDKGSTGVYGTTGRRVFSGEFVTFIDDELTDIPVCMGDQCSGTYQYSFTNNNLTFTKVDDQCTPRINYLDLIRVKSLNLFIMSSENQLNE